MNLYKYLIFLFDFSFFFSFVFFFFQLLAYSIIYLEPISSASMTHPVYFLDFQGHFDMELLITLGILLLLTLSLYHRCCGHLCTTVQPGCMGSATWFSATCSSSCSLSRREFYRSYMLLYTCSLF